MATQSRTLLNGRLARHGRLRRNNPATRLYPGPAQLRELWNWLNN